MERDCATLGGRSIDDAAASEITGESQTLEGRAMPVSQSIDPKGRWISLENTGPTDLASVRRALEALEEDPRLRPGMVMLADWTRTEGVAALDTAFECIRLAQGLTRVIGPFRIAVVVAREATAGVANASAVFAREQPQIELGVFRSRDEALAWLGVDAS